MPAPQKPGAAVHPTIPLHAAGAGSQVDLARWQQLQTGWNCANCAVATGMNMLLGQPVIKGGEVAQYANTRWWRDLLALRLFRRRAPWGLPTRTFPGFATAPYQQANLVNQLARHKQLPLTARFITGAPADLFQHLGRPDTAVIVAIGWNKTFQPRLARDSEAPDSHLTVPEAGGLGSRAHVVVLGAYDPGHTNHGVPFEWGLINSWAEGGQEIWWMPDADFQRVWGYTAPDLWLLGFRARSLVVVTKTP